MARGFELHAAATETAEGSGRFNIEVTKRWFDCPEPTELAIASMELGTVLAYFKQAGAPDPVIVPTPPQAE